MTLLGIAHGLFHIEWLPQTSFSFSLKNVGFWYTEASVILAGLKMLTEEKWSARFCKTVSSLRLCDLFLQEWTLELLRLMVWEGFPLYQEWFELGDQLSLLACFGLQVRRDHRRKPVSYFLWSAALSPVPLPRPNASRSLSSDNTFL